MNTLIITLIAAIIAVALMLVGLGLTRLVKGRDIQSDVGNNDKMKDLGLTCATQQMRQDEADYYGVECTDGLGCGSGCDSCEETENKEK